MTAVHETGEVEEQRSHTRRNARFFSRRSLLAGGAVAAASLAAGAGLGAALTSAQHSTSNGSNPGVSYGTVYQSTPLVPGGPGGIPTTWHFVTTVAQLGSRAVQFTADAIIGYVILKDSDEPGEKEEIIALSAACTHMGCIVQWQESDRSFHCPCHGGLFDAYGRPSAKGRMRYLAALPRLNVKVENGNIYVEVPKIDS
ncbi:MAG: Rieske 2Fe-2S domain-containing protein [Ktedonobacteraceae bacterium]|nr:Rieske 2Fe-2S domain-containing protein [Ktedonobacteraceae bacterium]